MAPATSVPAPSRKQNVACDACRQKKVRCLRESIAERCQQCAAKGAECTSHYIESLQTKTIKKRKIDDGPKASPRDGQGEASGSAPSSARAASSALPKTRDYSSVATARQTSGQGSDHRTMSAAQIADDDARALGQYFADASRRPSVYTRQSPTASASEKQQNLLRFLFSPEAVEDLQYGYNDIADIELCAAGDSDLWESQDGKVYREAPSEAHMSIPDEGLSELTEDILDTFWSIAHIRSPLFNPISFRERYAMPDTHPAGPVPHAMLAIAVAMGARFSDNPIIAHDRDEISERDEEAHLREMSQTDVLTTRERERQRGRTRSRIVQLLVARAREVAEACKTHRIANLENCQMLSLLEVLLGQSMLLKDKYQAYSALCSTRHAYALKLMSREHLESAFSDHAVRQAAGYTWWHIAAADGWRSIFNRLTPFLFDEDFEIDPKAFALEIPIESIGQAGDGAGQESSETPESLTVLWLSAANAGCYICRKLCNGLWTNRVRQYGISTTTLRDFVHYNSLWRDKYIAKLGVPSKWPEQWDFLAAISSCSTDAYYHCLWMIVHGAIKEFGLQDELDAAKDGGIPVNQVELESLKRRIREEAEHGATRMAALVGTLTENGYLRLDPLILIYPVYLAGLLLAESGKDEALVCVAGLKQYSIAYGYLWELAEEVEKLHERSVADLRSAQREMQGLERALSLDQRLLAPVGHMGDMGPWGLDVGQSFMSTSPGPGSTSARSPFDGAMASGGPRSGVSSHFSGLSSANDMTFGQSTGGDRRYSHNNDNALHLPPIQDLANLADTAQGGSSHHVKNTGRGGSHQFQSPSLPGTSSLAPELRSLGSMGPVRDTSKLGRQYGQGNDGPSMVPSPGGRSGSISLTESDKGKAKEDWHKTGAGAVLAANGFTALPMTPSSAGMPAAPSKDTASALFDWLQRP